MTNGQRGWNRQPDGIARGRATSPMGTMRSRRSVGSVTDTAQPARVGMARLVVDGVARADLDDLSQVHHHDAARHVEHHVEIAGAPRP